MLDGAVFYVKTLKGDHHCDFFHFNELNTLVQRSQTTLGDIRANPTMTTNSIKNLFMDKHSLETKSEL